MVTDVAFLAISLLTLGMSAALYRRVSGEPVWRLNMFNMSFSFLVPFAFIGSVLVILNRPVLGYDPQGMEGLFRGATDPRLKVWGAVMWMFIAIPLGGLVANAALRPMRSIRSISETMRRYREAPLEGGLRLNQHGLFVVVSLLSALVALWVILWLPEQTAFGALLQNGDVLEAQVVRRSAPYGSGIPVVDVLVNTALLHWLNLLALIMAYTTRRRKWWWLFALGTIVIVSVSVSRGTVGHVVYYLLSVAFVRACLGERFMSWPEALLGVLALGTLMAFLKGLDGSLFQILSESVYRRVVFGQLIGTYHALNSFPLVHDFIGLRSTGRLIHAVLGAEYLPSYGIIVMQIYNPAGVTAGTAGHFTTVFLGEAWANFGTIGLFLAPVWVGFVVQSVNRWFIVRPKSVLHLSFYAYLSLTFEYSSSFMAFYYPFGTIVFVVGTLTIIWIVRYLLVPRSRGVAGVPS
jgi:hypothetical protein